MKIAVLGGAGGMGAVFGAKLAGAGNEVALLDVSKDAVDAINKNGVTLELKTGEKQTVRVPATTQPETVGAVDLVINFVKCYHTDAAIRSILPILREGSLILSLQNGWGNAPVIAGIVGKERVLMGVTYHSATVLGPGHVLHAGQGTTFLGPLTGDRERAAPVARALMGAKLETTVSDNVMVDIWKKLALNICTLPTTAILRFTAGALVEHEGTLALMRSLLREGVAVARAQGITIDENERWETITGLLKRAGASKSSMLQDVEKGRRTEISVINGAIVAAGQKTGVPTPCNEAMLHLVTSLEETFPSSKDRVS